MEKITAYKCSFCKDSNRSIFLSRSGCRAHEKQCWLNPARKSCATCINLDEFDPEGIVFKVEWRCTVRKDITPFKRKIIDCPEWEESCAIFTNEEMLYNRPIERAKE